MKSELSKVMCADSILQDLQDEDFNSFNVLHSKRVTLLLQAHKSTGSGVGGGGGQMSKLTFLNVFDSHGPEEVKKLERVYAESHGKLPSRRQLSAIAQAINVQQSKIKKWFDRKAAEEAKPAVLVNDTFWADLNAKMNEIDDKIKALRESRL
jgi:hypothetical protein